MRILGIYDHTAKNKVQNGNGADAAEYSNTVSVQFIAERFSTYHVALSSKQRVRMCQKYTYDDDGAVDGLEGDPFPCTVQAKHPAPDYTFSVVED